MFPSDQPTKRCFKCGHIKPLTEFYVHKQMADGHLNKCKFCTRIDTLINRTKHEDYYREYDRQRNKSQHRREHSARNRKAYRAAHPERSAVYDTVSRAKKAGVLIPPERCPLCDCENMPIHAHHEDYSQALTVTWACPRCHHAHHHVRNMFTGEFR